ERLKARLDADATDRRFVARYNQIRLEQSEVDLETASFAQRDLYPKIKDAFQDLYQVQFGITPTEEVNALIRQRPAATQKQLLEALDACLAWTSIKELGDTLRWLKEVLVTADQDPWRNQVRGAWAAGDGPMLEKLAQGVNLTEQTPAMLLLV